MSGNIQPQSSQFAEPLWTDPGIKSGISVRKLISTLKEKKREKRQVGNEWLNILPKFSQARIKHHHQITTKKNKMKYKMKN